MSLTTTNSAPVLQPQSFAELVQFAKMACNSDLMPKDYRGKPENIMLAVQMGSEVGLSPMQAIQNISVINGRPAVWGDAMLALVRRDLRCENVIESIEGEGDEQTAICVVHRRGSKPVTGRFSVADAKKASLWSKQGPWQQYPQRMLQMRARGFALRDAFPDVLKGLQSAEEARDTPDTFTGQTIDAKPELQPAPAPKAAEYLADSIPQLEPSPDPLEVLRDRADRVVQALALQNSIERVEKAEKMARGLLADCDAADGAGEIKRMILDSFIAARERVEPSDAAEPQSMEMGMPE